MLVSALACRTLRPRLLSLPFRPLSPATRHFSQTPTRSFLRQTPVTRQTAIPPTPTPPPNPTHAPTDEAPSFLQRIGKPRIRNQILFVGLTSFVLYTVAAVQTSVETEYWTERMTAASAVWGVKPIKNEDLRRAQHQDLVLNLRQTLKSLNESISSLPGIVRSWLNVATVSVLQPYADASEGKRLCWKLVFLNTAVFVAWQIPGWHRFMMKSFMHHPLSGLSYTLITSTFSHKSFFHLLFNCLALESFGSAAYYYLLREQTQGDPEMLESTSAYHFLTFFITAGMFSGLVSHIVNVKFRYPRLIAQFALPSTAAKTETWASAVAATAHPVASAAASTVTKNKAKVLDILPSLGASGAVWASVMLTALAFPDSQVALFIPPSYPISIQYGVGGLLALDVIGILRGWRRFDHWAHLGGAAFGALYWAYGPAYWRFWRQEADDAKEEEEKIGA